MVLANEFHTMVERETYMQVPCNKHCKPLVTARGGLRGLGCLVRRHNHQADSSEGPPTSSEAATILKKMPGKQESADLHRGILAPVKRWGLCLPVNSALDTAHSSHVQSIYLTNISRIAIFFLTFIYLKA